MKGEGGAHETPTRTQLLQRPVAQQGDEACPVARSDTSDRRPNLPVLAAKSTATPAGTLQNGGGGSGHSKPWPQRRHGPVNCSTWGSRASSTSWRGCGLATFRCTLQSPRWPYPTLPVAPYNAPAQQQIASKTYHETVKQSKAPYHAPTQIQIIAKHREHNSSKRSKATPGQHGRAR